jgi:hypothetical protein
VPCTNAVLRHIRQRLHLQSDDEYTLGWLGHLASGGRAVARWRVGIRRAGTTLRIYQPRLATAPVDDLTERAELALESRLRSNKARAAFYWGTRSRQHLKHYRGKGPLLMIASVNGRPLARLAGVSA